MSGSCLQNASFSWCRFVGAHENVGYGDLRPLPPEDHTAFLPRVTAHHAEETIIDQLVASLHCEFAKALGSLNTVLADFLTRNIAHSLLLLRCISRATVT